MSTVLTRTARLGHSTVERGPSLLTRIVRLIAREIRTRRDLRELSSLDDAALHDIGLVRGSVEEAVRHGRSRRSLSSEVRPGSDCSLEPSTFTEWR